MATAAFATQKADAFLEPLLTYVNDDDSTVSADNAFPHSTGAVAGGARAATPSPMERLKAAAIYLVLAGEAALSVGAMVLAPVVPVFVMAGVAVAHTPYVAYKEHRIAKLPALRSLNNQMREDAEELERAVDVLTEEIDCLRPEAERAMDVEEELQGLTRAQGRNTNALLDMVKENAQIVAEMEDNLRQKIVQDVLGLVLKSDRDKDGVFSDKELTLLVYRIRIQLKQYGVEFDEDKFRRVMGRGASVAMAVRITQRLIPAHPDDEEEEAMDEDKEDFDMFHVSVTGGLARSLVGDGPPANRDGAAALGPSLIASQDPNRSLSRKGSAGSRGRCALSSSRRTAPYRAAPPAPPSPGLPLRPPSPVAAKRRHSSFMQHWRAHLGGAPATDPAAPRRHSHRKKRETLLQAWDHLTTNLKEGHAGHV